MGRCWDELAAVYCWFLAVEGSQFSLLWWPGHAEEFVLCDQPSACVWLVVAVYSWFYVNVVGLR